MLLRVHPCGRARRRSPLGAIRCAHGYPDDLVSGRQAELERKLVNDQSEATRYDRQT